MSLNISCGDARTELFFQQVHETLCKTSAEEGTEGHRSSAFSHSIEVEKALAVVFAKSIEPN